MNPHQGAEAQAGMSLELAGWWIFRGQKQWDPSPWVLAQARFTLIRSPGSRLSLGLRNRSGMTKCCRLVGIPCNYSLSTAAYWHLQFTRPGGLLMTAALSKFPGMVISEISSKNNQFSRSQLQQVYFPYILEGKKKKKTQNQHSRGCSVQSSRSVVSDSLWPKDYSTPGFPVHHRLPELAQTQVHWVGDAIQPSHPLSASLIITGMPIKRRTRCYLPLGTVAIIIKPTNKKCRGERGEKGNVLCCLGECKLVTATMEDGMKLP